MPTVTSLDQAAVNAAPAAQTIFWYRDLPPLNAEVVQEHTVDACSARVSGAIAYRGELWTTCYADAMSQVTRRLKQEITRLGGRYARVLSESVDSRHNAATGEAWLHIVLTYMLYK